VRRERWALPALLVATPGSSSVVFECHGVRIRAPREASGSV